MAILYSEFERAKRTTSLAGGLCQLSGSLMAVVGGLMTLGIAMGGGGINALLAGGSATFLLGLAGAPLAALGSIANSSKAQKELMVLYLKEASAVTERDYLSSRGRRMDEGDAFLNESSEDNYFAPPPPPPLPPVN